MMTATCCAMLLIVLHCHVMGRTVFTHRPLYDTACNSKGSVKTLSRRHTNAPHLCVHACVRQEDCWLAAYRIRTQICFLVNGTCPGLKRFSNSVLWVFSNNDRYIRDLLAAYPSNWPAYRPPIWLWTISPFCGMLPFRSNTYRSKA